MFSSHWMLPNLTSWTFNGKPLMLIITAATANTQKVVASSLHYHFFTVSQILYVTSLLHQIMWLPWCNADETLLVYTAKHPWKTKLLLYITLQEVLDEEFNKVHQAKNLCKAQTLSKHLILWETVTRRKIPLLTLKGFFDTSHPSFCNLQHQTMSLLPELRNSCLTDCVSSSLDVPVHENASGPTRPQQDKAALKWWMSFHSTLTQGRATERSGWYAVHWITSSRTVIFSAHEVVKAE